MVDLVEGQPVLVELQVKHIQVVLVIMMVWMVTTVGELVVALQQVELMQTDGEADVLEAQEAEVKPLISLGL
jgi:hypothetical protein